MAPIKRLIVCCDGTWNDSISTNNPLTNVARFSRCVEDRTEDDILQIVYYHTGVGVGTSRISNSIDGAVGRGLGANVRNAYNFICQNFNHKDGNDEIYLVGFSRDAFTVRCVASLIDTIGLLNKRGLSRLYDAYNVWKKKADDRQSLQEFVLDLKSKNLVTTGVKIKACGVWDTVSAIGIQLPGWLPQPPPRKLAHVDNRIPPSVENAFHAMALDERRSAFWPLPWSQPHHESNLQQCWFLGAHADVGGGYDDAGLANVAIVWMIAQFQRYTSLGFDRSCLLDFLVRKELHVKREEIKASVGVFGRETGWSHVRETSGYKSEAGEEPGIFARNERMLTRISGRITNSLTPLWRPLGQRRRQPHMPFLINKVHHSVGLTGAMDDLGITTSSAPHDNLNTGIVVADEQANMEIDGAASVEESLPALITSNTIHFTVRLLLAKQYRSCHVLRNFFTIKEDQHISWQRLEEHGKEKSKRPKIKSDEHQSINEAEITAEEDNLFRLWLNTAADRGISSTRKEEVSWTKTTASALPVSLGASSTREHSHSFSFRTSEEVKNMLDSSNDLKSVDLAFLLFAHIEEIAKPTLMYNSDATSPMD